MTAAQAGLTACERIAGIQLNLSLLTTGALTIAKTRLAAVMTWLKGLTLAQALAWLRHTAAKVASCAATVALSLATKGLAGAYLALASAMAVVSAHPIIAAIVAVTAVVAALVLSLRQACMYTAKLSDEQSKLADKELKKRKTDQIKFDFLNTLAGKDKLSEKEIVRANQLISDLTGIYGDIGMAVDLVNKKIIKATDSQDKFNAAARKQAADRLAAQIAEEKKNLDELRKQEEGNRKSREGVYGLMTSEVRAVGSFVSGGFLKSGAKAIQLDFQGAWAGMNDGWIDTSSEKWEKDIKAAAEEIEAQQKKIRDLEKQKSQIEGGDTARAFGADEDEALQKELQDAAISSEDRAKKIIELEKEIAKAEEDRAHAALSATEKVIANNNREIQSYQDTLAARIKQEQTKPESEQDKNKISALNKKIQELEQEKGEFASKKRREEEQRKINDAQKLIDDLENRFSKEMKSDLENTLELIQRETEEYKKQLELLKQQLSTKKEKSTAELKAIEEINEKLKHADAQGEARKERARKKEEEQRAKEEKPAQDNHETRWHQAIDRQLQEEMSPYKKELDTLTARQKANLVMTDREKRRIKELETILADMRSQATLRKVSLSDALRANAEQRVPLTEQLGTFAARGDQRGYARTLARIQRLDTQKTIREFNLLAVERRQAFVELKKIDRKDDPEAYEKAYARAMGLNTKLLDRIRELTPDMRGRDLISQRLQEGFSQVEYAAKQGSGSFSAFEAAQAGRQALQESAIEIARLQAKYLRSIKDNTEKKDAAVFA